MFTPEQKAKLDAILTPEQKEIVESRLEGTKSRLALLDELAAALNNKDYETRDKILIKVFDSDSHLCEHGRSYCKPCLACDEIDAIIHDITECSEEDCEICNRECDDSE